VTDEGDEPEVPDELAALDAELRRAERRAEHRIDPGPSALVVSVAMLVLIGSLMLPWTGSVQGWEVLAGSAALGLLPPLFAGTSLAFGLVGSALALGTRWFGMAWLAAVGCGFSVLTGVWAIWSRQVGVPAGGTGAGFGLVLAVLAVLVLAATWVRIATRR
jgi:cation transport ATPase